MELTPGERRALLKLQQTRTDAALTYRALAIAAKDAADTALFRALSEEEARHASVLQGLTGEGTVPNRRQAARITGFGRVFGRERLYRLLIRDENRAAARFRQLSARFPALKALAEDAKRHGQEIAALPGVR